MTIAVAMTTSVDYVQPFRPWPVTVANQIGRWLVRMNLGAAPLTVDALVAEARAKTGLVRFDDEAFREPLGVLVDSIEREARLSPVGSAMVRRALVGVLSTRLRAQALFERHPEILEEEIAAPVFIVGLQRAGTTMLHRLLAADPGFRALLSWEALRPVPEPRSSWRGGDPRISRAVVEEHGLRYMAPDFFAVHSVEAESPEEEVVLLDHSFLSTVARAVLHVPTYAAWIERRDQTPAYAYLKKMLQLLQWQRRGERWILKTPHHLEWLDTLLAVFPDAKIIQTHRDPVKSVASFCSMIAHARGVFSDAVDPYEIGDEWTAKTQRMVDRAMETRDRVGGSPFIDVSYYDLMADPIGEVEKIYRRIRRPLSEQARACMEAARNANPQHKHGKHTYELADFGLDPADIDARFLGYRIRHQIRYESYCGSLRRRRLAPVAVAIADRVVAADVRL
jgi:hypothetical protein